MAVRFRSQQLLATTYRGSEVIDMTDLADLTKAFHWAFQVVNNFDQDVICLLVGFFANNPSAALDLGLTETVRLRSSEILNVDANYWTPFQGLRLRPNTNPGGGNLIVTAWVQEEV